MATDPKFDESDSPIDTSEYVSAASNAGSQFAEVSQGPDCFRDSQESDNQSLIEKHELLSDKGELSDSSISNSIDGSDPLQSLGLEVGSRSSEVNFKDHEKLHFVEFDTDHTFDDALVTRLDKFEDLSKGLETPLTKPSSSKAFNTDTIEKLKSTLKHSVPNAYLEMVFRENHSQQFQDWFFITEDGQAENQEPWDLFLNQKKPRKTNLRCLLRSFGVSSQYMPESSEAIITTMFDGMNYLESIEWMCQQLEDHTESIGFDGTFLRFILDRNVFNSAECTSSWCSNIYGKLCQDRFLRIYLQLVAQDEYLLHLRVSRQIPEFHEVLLERLFPRSSQQTFIHAFDKILRSKDYSKLLYFVLFIYGTKKMPFGITEASVILKDQIHDLCEDGNQLELIIVRSYINFFMKIV
ncbi:LANO_0D01398g1_1 [Lachancea nothofagi CBS 11611]|uniref:LANO_0D01398g1_1 n=1 Tax=Lachancea nothofagi CBS 11611 TaxID=1266666 RepID=A0A1G4JDC7_9SACH|nr:LANO_0D01398g1_1 [Lachancea nothofagi CBS 11611]